MFTFYYSVFLSQVEQPKLLSMGNDCTSCPPVVRQRNTEELSNSEVCRKI